MRILLVDDDADIRAILELVLAQYGHEVRSAADGLEALELLRGGLRPSLILLDLMMPRCDGEAFVQALRKSPEIPVPRIVILSGHAGAQAKVGELGAAGCLVKPVELDELLNVIRSEERRASSSRG
jgi:CheY-like chemotaxis protein